MSIQNLNQIAALIAAHPNRKIFGRTRLQKEVKLLQRLGFPTTYSYSIHFYGPYSESLQSDIGLLEAFGMLSETSSQTTYGPECFVLEVKDLDGLPDISQFQEYVDLMNKESTVILELAATYDAFREQNDSHENAVKRLRRKKGNKCDNGNEAKAFDLLYTLGLIEAEHLD